MDNAPPVSDAPTTVSDADSIHNDVKAILVDVVDKVAEASPQ